MSSPALQGVTTTLVSSSGGSTDITGKSVFYYFSAHWCPPCRAFTPQLVKAYETFKAKNCEIVFVSADKNQAAFDEYFGEQPWLAIPFDDEDAREAIGSKFEVGGYPTLVAVAADGTVISKKARGLFSEDPSLSSFPAGWTPPKNVGECLAGAPLTNSKLAAFDWAADVASKDIVGLYFSAHWCPPCRAFTPKLVEWYGKMKAAGHSIELVFVSSDRDQGQWMEYLGTMPWLALNIWEDEGRAARARLEKVEGSVEHEGIPHLVLLKGSNLAEDVISGDPASRIRGDVDGFPWPAKPCESIDVALESINTKAVAMVFAADECADECIAAVAEAAVPFFGDGAPSSAPVCTVVPQSHPAVGRLAGFLGLTGFTASTTQSLLVITDIPSGKKHVTKLAGTPSADDITLAIAAFIAGSAAMIELRETPSSL